MAGPRLFLFCGIPGSGKTTVAVALSRKLGRSMFIQTDALRTMLARPVYTGPESRFIYSALIAVGAEALRAGYETLLEGTFPREEYRTEALRVLAPLAAQVLIIYTHCRPEVAFGRNAGRHDPVPWDSFLRIYSRFEEPMDAIRVDTESTPPDVATQRIVSSLSSRA